VNLLILHEAFSPSTPRLLREAAALLSPQSVAMPVQQAEHVTPITGGTDTTAQTKALFASILQLANSGAQRRHLRFVAFCLEGTTDLVLFVVPFCVVCTKQDGVLHMR
jgi:hypothetical protein